MVNEKHHIEQGVFYITNVCNLTCEYCETYNNRRFKGHFLWEDHRDYYQEWAKKLTIDFITIIGGEPFANPDLYNWVSNIQDTFVENHNLNICTNGTYLKDNQDLAKKIVSKGVWLDISIHDPSHYDEILDSLEKIIQGFDYSLEIKNQERLYKIGDKMLARLYPAYIFNKSSAKYIRNGMTYMHNSDPEKSHALCVKDLGHCHFFVRGKLFHCYLTAISQDLTEQFQIEDRAKDILNSYVPCSPYDDDSAIKSFIQGLTKPIKQCQVCPEKNEYKVIWPLEKTKRKYEA